MSEQPILSESPLFVPAAELGNANYGFNRCRCCNRVFEAAEREPFSKLTCQHCGAKLVIPRMFGDYWLLDRLSVTERNRVYLAQDPLLDRMVALKVVRPDKFDSDATERRRRRLYHDAQVQTQINHENVVAVYRACQLESKDFKISEFLNGGKLKFHENPELRTDPVVALTGLAEVAAFLEAAAEANITHGNITPDHLIFNEQGSLKLINFRPPEDASPEAALPQDEFIYSAPERLLDYELSAAGDVYSLGVVIYTYLAAVHPMGYLGDISELDLVDKQQRNPVKSLKGISDINDDALFALVEAMLSPHPTSRPSAGEAALTLLKATGKIARRRNIKMAMHRLSAKLQEGIAKLQVERDFG